MSRASLLPANVRRAEPASDPGAPAPKNKPTKKNRAEKNRAEKNRAELPKRLWFQRLSLFTGIVVVVAASLLCAWGLRRYLRSSARFAVRVVSVEGNTRRTPHQISKRAGIVVGKNIFEIDEASAVAALQADPWISSATVSTDLPNSVFVKVVERDARALASVDSHLFLVDVGGDIFKECEEGDPHDLPVVTGIDSDMVARDREAVTIRLRRALDLLADLEQAGLAKRFPIQELHIERDTSVTITLGVDALALAFGMPPYRAKIAKAERILGELRVRQVKPAVIFLDNVAHPERVVVRMK